MRGFGQRRSLDPENERAASVVLVRHGRILLLRRGRTDPWMPGAWNFPGGGVEAWETERAGAVREVSEEAGVCVDPNALRFLARFRQDGRSIAFFVAPQFAGDISMPDGEHDKYVWATPREVAAYPTTPYVQEVARRLER